MSIRGPIVDRFGRQHTNLRISVTDRCNVRCLYCMSDEPVQFKSRPEILTFEELERFVRVAVALGVNRLRLTGGEPLLRADLPLLIRNLVEIEGVTDVALTTNGLLLAGHAEALKASGLHRLNISLDGLSDETFRRITRREGLDRVLQGIEVARALRFRKIRLNAVAIRGMNDDEIVPLAEFARKKQLDLRFISFMPLDADNNWRVDQVWTGAELRAHLEDRLGPLVPLERADPSRPAVDYEFADGAGRIGFIDSVFEPFCHACNRLRLTAEGVVHSCLFAQAGWDARALLRGGASDGQLAELLRACVAAKGEGHNITSPDFMRTGRPMHQLGG